MSLRANVIVIASEAKQSVFAEIASGTTDCFAAALRALLAMTIWALPLCAADPISDFPARVKKITLQNGFRAILVERPESPTVSFAMYIRTGGLDDAMGKSGLAHMFEHMLFKGTKTIGVENPEEYWEIYERAGAQNMNASTGYDFTNYVVSLPKNRVTLWMMMESDRIRNPVLRDFYKERSVVLEERRLRIDSSPRGKLWEAFLATAFLAHPYGRPIVGWESDISRVTQEDAEVFFKKHYDVSRLVVAIVGGFKSADIEAQLKKHFASIPSVKEPSGDRIPIEPAQEGERRVQVHVEAEPSLLMGYHRPDLKHPDGPALDVAARLLGDGRTSRFNKSIVEKKRIAVSAWAGATAPGERDPNLFVMGGQPRHPHTVQDLERAIEQEVALLASKKIEDTELEKVKNNLEISVLGELASNLGLAQQLAYHEAVAGDWAMLFEWIKQVRAVTEIDVKRVVSQYLVPSNKTVGVLVRKKS